MEFALLGWPPDAPTLRLDYRRFAYAGKFVLGSTGKAVVADGENGDTEYDDHILAAASFSPDRTDDDRLCIRYVTVREDRQGEGLGARLLAFVAAHAADRYDRVRIAVNNPAAYVAAHRAGFAFTGRETGLAELVCERPTARPAARDADTYCAGLDRYRERDLDADAMTRLDEKRAAGPPSVVDAPAGVGGDEGSEGEPGS
ncbi:GNAT family N-acetyltransferase [Haloplanus aerogenes]|uniref:Acetyltransferase (GNAT) family protein n=1 Tax=Haloplanus aerogenes TaxID=660522 RepID=A0A3M0D8U1_9EURY|nr:GNAT family N-acetyltransferase [Haloplanus aerogenes]AZH26437.1 N-acetyltransferase [Haloplanus aerogenes]RMB18098.1 acetyltransferase (GNAT) family protein [Haloplanus aerogenes]